ncbi:MAG: hypothetical protein QM730_05540 [Anaerolineales bacterium]
MNILFRFLLLALTIAAITYTTVAFASSQSDQQMGGEGMSSISGWDVSGVHYLLANDPSKLAGVEFDLSGPANTVKVHVSAASMFWTCRNTGRYHWVCDANATVSISEMNELKVIATGL